MAKVPLANNEAFIPCHDPIYIRHWPMPRGGQFNATIEPDMVLGTGQGRCIASFVCDGANCTIHRAKELGRKRRSLVHPLNVYLW